MKTMTEARVDYRPPAYSREAMQDARARLGLTVPELARTISVPVPTLRGWLYGVNRRPRNWPLVALALAALLDVRQSGLGDEWLQRWGGGLFLTQDGVLTADDIFSPEGVD